MSTHPTSDPLTPPAPADEFRGLDDRPWLRRVVHKVYDILVVNYAEMNEYRAELVLWAVVMALPVIMMGLWAEVAGEGTLPLSRVEMVRYFIAGFVVRQVTVVWAIHHMEWLVVSGRLSPQLLQPLDPVWRLMLLHLAEQAARVPFSLAVVALALCIYPEGVWGTGQGPADQPDHGIWWPGWRGLIGGLVAMYAAFVVRFLMQYTLAMLAFWQERVSAMDGLLYLPYLFLSGLLAPLEVFPEGVRQWVMLTPFPYMAWYPARLLTGADLDIVQPVLVMTAWGVPIWLLSRWVWRRGLRHYSAMGA